MKLKWLWLSCLIIACKHQATLELPFYNSPEFTPEWIAKSDSNYSRIHTVGSFQFTNQKGETIDNADLAGKIYAANFFFTSCPSVCPRMTENLLRVQDAYGDDPDVKLVSHTVMPWVDSVETLNEYANIKGINNDHWYLLTGEKDKLYQVARQYYFADEGFGKTVTSESDFLHTENIVLIDQKGRIRGVYNGTLPLQINKLIEDIGRLKSDQ